MALHIKANGRSLCLELQAKEPLADAAARAGLTLNTRCGGLGVCAGCRVDLVAGRFRVDDEEVVVGEGAKPVRVRACRTRLVGSEGSVRFPPASVAETGAQIDDQFEEGARPIVSRPPSSEKAGLGIAADIGTTTVAALLVDVSDGAILGRASMYNQQIGRADDVASRISYASTPEKLRELQHRVMAKTLAPLIEILCARAGVHPDRVERLALSGNTVMMHLCYGLSPESIGRLPFEPVTRVYPARRAKELGLPLAPEVRVEAVPSIAGYLGGDITSGLHVTGLHQNNETAVLIDVGTNGEIVLHHEGRVSACATAAGPAFEGAGLSCGCRAAKGAIEHLSLDRDLHPRREIIGGGAPKGICGSGVVDFLAAGLRRGLINTLGRFDVPRLKASGRYYAAGESGRPIHAYLLAGPDESLTGEPDYFSEQDVAHVLKAKAAIFAGLQTLLESEHIPFHRLARVHLAGGFARHLDIENAIRIGLFPNLARDRFQKVGNSSLAGALRALTDADAMPAFRALIDLPRIIELNLHPGFEGHFIDALALPHMDKTLFSDPPLQPKGMTP